jgi:hypothetical protein
LDETQQQAHLVDQRRMPVRILGIRAVQRAPRDGKTFTSISPVVNGTAAPFNGDLLASIALIKSIGAIPNGGTQKLFVICSSEPGGTGNTTNVMTTYITYSANGNSYTTSTKAPAGS